MLGGRDEARTGGKRHKELHLRDAQQKRSGDTVPTTGCIYKKFKGVRRSKRELEGVKGTIEYGENKKLDGEKELKGVRRSKETNVETLKAIVL